MSDYLIDDDGNVFDAATGDRCGRVWAAHMLPGAWTGLGGTSVLMRASRDEAARGVWESWSDARNEAACERQNAAYYGGDSDAAAVLERDLKDSGRGR